MLKILYRLDDMDNVEANLVAEAANILGIGEFQFFQLAYQSWYGAEMDPQALERDFLLYMLHDKVPLWVRQYARTIIARSERGELDTESMEFHRFDRGVAPPSYTPGGMAKVALVVVGFSLFLFLFLTIYQPIQENAGSCNFPPCSWYQ